MSGQGRLFLIWSRRMKSKSKKVRKEYEYKQMIAKGLLISLMAGAVTGCSAVREKILFLTALRRSLRRQI